MPHLLYYCQYTVCKTILSRCIAHFIVTVAERHKPARGAFELTHTHTHCNYIHSGTKLWNEHAKHHLMYSPVTYRTTIFFLLSLVLVCTKRLAAQTTRFVYMCIYFYAVCCVRSAPVQFGFVCLPHLENKSKETERVESDRRQIIHI